MIRCQDLLLVINLREGDTGANRVQNGKLIEKTSTCSVYACHCCQRTAACQSALLLDDSANSPCTQIA